MKKWENADVVELSVKATALAPTEVIEVDDETTGHVGKNLDSSGEKTTAELYSR